MTYRPNRWYCAWLICTGSLATDAWATVYAAAPTDGSSVVGTGQRIEATYKDALLDIAHVVTAWGTRKSSVPIPALICGSPARAREILLPGAADSAAGAARRFGRQPARAPAVLLPRSRKKGHKSQ